MKSKQPIGLITFGSFMFLYDFLGLYLGMEERGLFINSFHSLSQGSMVPGSIVYRTGNSDHSGNTFNLEPVLCF